MADHLPQRITGVFLLAVAVCLVPLKTFAAQESFPYLAEVTTDNLNVRAGVSTNFEQLCQLHQGDSVVVIAKLYGWYKIQLPLSTKVYMSDKYVHLASATEGEITADHVNVRARMDTKSTILGQLDKGQRVYIASREKGWYGIQAPPQVCGWVSEGYLKFKSRDIAGYRPVQVIPPPQALPPVRTVQALPAVAPARPAPVQVQIPPRHIEPVRTIPAPAPIAVAPPKKEAVKTTESSSLMAKIWGMFPKEQNDAKHVSVTGYLKPNGRLNQTLAPYELLVHDRPAYYMQGFNQILDEFKDHTISVEGTINTDVADKFPYPVIHVSKIQLML